MTGADDFLRLDAFDMRALVGYDAIGLSRDRSVAEHGDDRVCGDRRIDRQIDQRSYKGMPGAHVFNRSRTLARFQHAELAGFRERRELRYQSARERNESSNERKHPSSCLIAPAMQLGRAH